MFLDILNVIIVLGGGGAFMLSVLWHVENDDRSIYEDNSLKDRYKEL